MAVPGKAPEAARKREQVAPKAVEAVILPVPVAPTKMKKRKSPPKAAEVDQLARGLRVEIQFKPKH